MSTHNASSSSSGGGDSAVPVVVMCGEGRHTVPVQLAWTVARLKTVLQAVLGETAQGKTIRLIHAGRQLTDDGQTLAAARVVEGTVIHAALTEVRGAHQGRAATQRLAAAFTLPQLPQLHQLAGASAPALPAATPATGGPRTAIGQPEEPAVDGQPTSARSEAAEDGASVASPAGRRHMGFDRLRVAGLTDDDITTLRALYLPEVQREVSDSVVLQQGETEAHRLLRMEEAWMQRQGPYSEFAMNVRPVIMSRMGAGDGSGTLGVGADGESEEDARAPSSSATPQGTFAHLVLGVILGSMLGVLMLVWTIFPTVNRQFKLGILIGVGIGIMLDLYQLEAAQEAQQASAGAAGTTRLRGGLYLDGNTLGGT